MINYKVGDRVRMKPNYAVHQNSTNHNSVEWAKRKGTATRIGKYNNQTAVLWDDRKSLDQWPSNALEKIDEPTHD